MAITKEFFSAGANGAPIPVVATGSPGTLIHTAHATAKDEIWLLISNPTPGDIIASVEKGGVSPSSEFNIPARSTVRVLPGVPLSNSLTVNVYGASVGLVADGWVNRIA